jgi:sugar phosphate permease
MLLPSMGKALLLGYDQMGYIGTGNFAGYLAAVAMAPFLMHWWGGRITITFGLVLLAACMILIGHGTGFLFVLALYFLTGIGSGLANVPMMVLVSHWFTKAKRGQAAGIMLAGNGLAIIFAGMLVPLLNQILGADGWRSGWQILGAISAGIAVTAGLLLRNSPADLPRGTRQARGSWFTSVSCTFSSDSRT